MLGYEKDYGQVIVWDSPLMNNNNLTFRIAVEIAYGKVKTGSPDAYVELNLSSP